MLADSLGSVLADSLGSALPDSAGSAALVVVGGVAGLVVGLPPPFWLLPTWFITQLRQRVRSSVAVTVSPAPSSACWVAPFCVQVPLRVSLESFAGGGVAMSSQAASAFFWFLSVDALETWVTVTMPPKATSVAATATIRRLPLNHPVFLVARRYFDLRIWGEPFSDAIGRRSTAPGRYAWS